MSSVEALQLAPTQDRAVALGKMNVMHVFQIQRRIAPEPRGLIAAEFVVVEVDVEVVPEGGQFEQIRNFDSRQNYSLIDGQLSMSIEVLQRLLSGPSCIANVLPGKFSITALFLLARGYRRDVFRRFDSHFQGPC